MSASLQSSDDSGSHLASTAQSRLLQITRTFSVPVARLFDAFTTADALKHWWWPKGIYSDHIDYEFREGGRYYINMKGFGDGSGGMTGQFEQIAKDLRIVMTDYFANKDGAAISAKDAGMAGDWPEVIYITFDFEEIDEDRSRLKLSQQGIPNEMQADCTKGWSESFDKLERYLS